MVSWIVIVLIINALIGAACLEFAWKNFKPIREATEEQNAQFPQFRRHDLKLWSKFKFYIGAVTILPIRFIIGILILIITFIFVKYDIKGSISL